MKKSVFCLIVLSFVASSFAADTTATPASPDLARLQKFVGSWKITFDFSSSDGTGKGTGEMNFKTSAATSGLTGDFWFESPGMPKLAGDHIWGYDSETGVTSFTQTTSDGHVNAFKGVWLDDNNFSAHWQGIYMGMNTNIDFVVTFISANEFHVRERDTFQGGAAIEYKFVFKK
jgi:hypothetical protein